MERDVRGVCRGVDETQALEVTPVGLFESLVAILWVFQGTALDRRGDRVWRGHEVVRGGRARWTSRLLVEGDHYTVQTREGAGDLQQGLLG